ncbi:MAG: glycosyltransferase involved in cell wall biosynthesis [Vicingaceae bacterium]|jgi:glycosyltransferase involved in cell wall biosynthesis
MELQVIHVLLGKANPNRMNGVNKMVNSLAEHQSIIGKDVTVWGITKNPVHNYPRRIYKTKLFKDTGKFSGSTELRIAIELLANESVIFHLHGGFIPQFYLIAKLLVKHQISYVFTPHGAFNKVALQRSQFKKKIYVKLLEGYLVKHAKHVHLIGESEIAGTQEVFGDVPYQLIPNGQDSIAESSLSNSKNGNCVPIFGFIGRLDLHTKGLDTLLKGFAAQLHKTNKISELWLIGDGPDKAKLEKLAQNLHIAKQMKFLGAQYGEKKYKLLNQLDFLCLVSRNEGLPGAVLEAASAGIPAIVSRETNLESYIIKNNAGFVTEDNTTEGVTAALIAATKCIEEKNNFRLGQNAIQMVKKDFNWSVIAKEHLFTYEIA